MSLLSPSVKGVWIHFILKLLHKILILLLSCFFHLFSDCKNYFKSDSQCTQWANEGECSRNPGWMLFNCAVGCRVCGSSKSYRPWLMYICDFLWDKKYTNFGFRMLCWYFPEFWLNQGFVVWKVPKKMKRKIEFHLIAWKRHNNNIALTIQYDTILTKYKMGLGRFGMLYSDSSVTQWSMLPVSYYLPTLLSTKYLPWVSPITSTGYICIIWHCFSTLTCINAHTGRQADMYIHKHTCQTFFFEILLYYKRYMVRVIPIKSR